MYEAFRSYLEVKSITQWRISTASVHRNMLDGLRSAPGPQADKPHIEAEATMELLTTHTHLFVMLLPIPGPEASRPEPDKPVLAPFAAHHFYKEAVAVIKEACSRLYDEARISKSDVRIFSNSRFPEKRFALGSGLGGIGKNGLLLNAELGSSFIIAGAAVNAPDSGLENLCGAPAAHIPDCGGCMRCIENCPVDAIDPESGFIRRRCLQHRSTETEAWDEDTSEKWNTRLYGCMSCQDVCPWNKRSAGRSSAAMHAEYDMPVFSQLLKAFLDERPLKDIFKGTALETSWIPRNAILRNLITAAANAPLSDEELINVKKLLPQIEANASSEVRAAVYWFNLKRSRQNY